MEVCNPKGGRTTALAFPAMLLMMTTTMMLLNAYCCGAAVLAKSNTSFRCSDSRLDECLIEEDLELELGFLMNPYVSRMLAKEDSIQSKDPNKPAVATCGKDGDNPAYSKCISKPDQKTKTCKPGSSYSRDCQPPGHSPTLEI